MARKSMQALKEDIVEYLWNNEDFHDYVTEAAKEDLATRSLKPEDVSPAVWDELICMGQTKYMGIVLMNVIHSHLT